MNNFCAVAHRRGVGLPECTKYHAECDRCGWNPVVEQKRRNQLRVMTKETLAQYILFRASQYATAAKRLPKEKDE